MQGGRKNNRKHSARRRTRPGAPNCKATPRAVARMPASLWARAGGSAAAATAAAVVATTTAHQPQQPQQQQPQCCCSKAERQQARPHHLGPPSGQGQQETTQLQGTDPEGGSGGRLWALRPSSFGDGLRPHRLGCLPTDNKEPKASWDWTELELRRGHQSGGGHMRYECRSGNRAVNDWQPGHKEPETG